MSHRSGARVGIKRCQSCGCHYVGKIHVCPETKWAPIDYGKAKGRKNVRKK